MTPMTVVQSVVYAFLLAGPQTQDAKLLQGALNDRLVPESVNAVFPMKLSDGAWLAERAEGDRIFEIATPQFRPAGAPNGLRVAFVEANGAKGGRLFIDANVDGRFDDSERIAYTPAASYNAAREVQLDIQGADARGPALPFRCRVVAAPRAGEQAYFLHFSASFRAEGYVDIGGRRTLISLPYNAGRGEVNVRQGRIGIDANGDGTVDVGALNGPETIFARGDQPVFRIGDRYFSVESADFAARAFVLREHAANEYTLIDVRAGTVVPDFTFTDFDGRERKLSEFRGKYLLLDFWGSWCGPCVDELPSTKAAYDRFRNRGFEVLGIDYEHGAPLGKVRKLLEEKAVTWTNAVPDSVRDLVEKRFRIWGFPTFILLDPDGVIVETSSRQLRGQALIATLEKVLANRAPR